MAGAAAFATTSVQYARMQSVVSRLLRKVMMGQASHERHGGRQRTLTNVQVLELFDLAPIHIDLAVRRLRMLVAVVAELWYHELFASAMFGEYVSVDFATDGPHPDLQQLKTRLRAAGFLRSAC